MKKIIGLLLGFMSVCALSACDLTILLDGLATSENVHSERVESVQSEVVESVTSEESGAHKHILVRVSERQATCAMEGNATYYKCSCGSVFETTIIEPPIIGLYPSNTRSFSSITPVVVFIAFTRSCSPDFTP